MGHGRAGEGKPGGEAGFGAALRSFSLRVLVGTALAAAAVALVLRWWGGAGPAPSPEAPTAAPRAPAAPRPARPAASGAASDEPPATDVAREVERRRAAGALSEAQKRLDRCPGGDVRRQAWIDPRSGVVKLVRERDDGLLLEEWFDDDGRLREARWRGGAEGRAWGGGLTVDAGGRETATTLVGGAVPDAPPPALDRRDPTAAFFAVPRCPP